MIKKELQKSWEKKAHAIRAPAMPLSTNLLGKASPKKLTPCNQRGQAATEFMLFVGAGIFLLLLFTLIASFYLRFNTVQQDELTAQDLGHYLRDEINLAAMVENGYSRTIAIPNQLDGQDYSLYIGDTAMAGGKTGKRELLVEYAGNEYVESLAVDVNSGMSITGVNKRDTITISKGNNQVTLL